SIRLLRQVSHRAGRPRAPAPSPRREQSPWHTQVDRDQRATAAARGRETSWKHPCQAAAATHAGFAPPTQPPTITGALRKATAARTIPHPSSANTRDKDDGTKKLA